MQSRIATMGCRCFRELDPADGEVASCLLQKKSKGTADLNHASGWTMATKKGDFAYKLPSQDRFGRSVVGIAVDASAGKVFVRVVIGRVETSRVGLSHATHVAAANVAIVLDIEQRLQASLATSRAVRWFVNAHLQHASPVHPHDGLDCGKAGQQGRKYSDCGADGLGWRAIDQRCNRNRDGGQHDEEISPLHAPNVRRVDG